MLGLLIPWWGRWAAIGVAMLASAAFGAAKMHQHDQEKYDAREVQFKLAGERQVELTQQVIVTHQRLRELSDADAERMRLERDAAVFAANRLRLANADRRIVPSAPTGAAGGNRVCFSREELDRGLRAAIQRLQGRALANAAEGQRSADVAVTCREWVKRF